MTSSPGTLTVVLSPFGLRTSTVERIVVSPLTEFEELNAFLAALSECESIRRATLEEYDYPVATYRVETVDRLRLPSTVLGLPGFRVQQLASAGEVLTVFLRPATDAVPAAESGATAPRAVNRATAVGRSGRKLGYLAVALVAAGIGTAGLATLYRFHVASSPPEDAVLGSLSLGMRQARNGIAVGTVAQMRTHYEHATVAAFRATIPTRSVGPIAAGWGGTLASALAAQRADLPTDAPKDGAQPADAAPMAAAEPPTATQVVAALQQLGMPIATDGTVGVETAAAQAADGNVAYKSASRFQDARLTALAVLSAPPSETYGGAVEVYANDADAAQRLQELAAAGQAAPDAAEFLYQDGTRLVRLSHLLTPEQLQGYLIALAAIQ